MKPKERTLLKVLSDSRANSAKVRVLLQQSGISVPEGREIRARDLVTAYGIDPNFGKNLVALLYGNTAGADGDLGLNSILGALGSAMSSLFGGTVSDDVAIANLKAQQAMYDAEAAKAKAESNSGTWIAVAVVVVVLLVIGVFAFQYAKK